MEAASARLARQRLAHPSSLSSAANRHICLQCRYNHARHLLATSSSTFTSSQRRHKSSNSGGDNMNPFLTGLRKRIWGTEFPPGQRDPYKHMTPEEKEIEAREMEEERKQAAEKQVEAELQAQAEADYVPATSGQGLERIGGPRGWWEKAWDRENQFHGYLTGPKIAHKHAARTVRRVLVELLALKEAGQPLSYAGSAPVSSDVDYEGIEIEDAGGGQVGLRYMDPALKIELLDSLGATDEQALAGVVGAAEDPESEELDQLEDSEESPRFDDIDSQVKLSSYKVESLQDEATDAIGRDATWLSVPLHDTHFKFNFVKRLMQLTGTRIHDPKISEFQTVGDVVDHLSEKPKPKKLADALLSQPSLMALPNVEIFERRHTQIDKEKEVGRWKVIEAELIRRGLPVTGHTPQPRQIGESR